ncbi:MAG: alpha-L-arabinofuranosidase [Bacteroidota bacterium]
MKTTIVSLAMLLYFLLPVTSSCKKTGGGSPNPPVDTTDTTTVNPQVDPAIASSIGFFLDDWLPKNFTQPSSSVTTTTPSSTTVTINIDRSNVVTKIPRAIAGNNSNIWMGQYVTEPSLLNHITKVQPHIIRFPGGSISDIFFWNAQPGVPPVDAPTNLVNASGASSAAGFWFGKNTADWTFSVDNYYSMLQQTNNQGMITVNYGYARYGKSANPVAAAAQLAADWVRYDNGRTKYWEIGNENFGDWEAGYRIKVSDNQDGQPEYLSGQLYGQHFKVFADSMRSAAASIGKTIYIGAVMSESAPQSWWTATATNWNSGLMNGAGSYPDFYIVHNYYTPYQTNANAATILATPQSVTQTMMDYVKQQITAGGAAQKPFILGEWNITSQGSKQQVSHINGLHATMILGEAIKNKYGMTARWDLANGWSDGNDHGLFNIGDEPGGIPKWNPRPAFYHMYFFQKYCGDRLVSSTSSDANVVSYATSFSSGETGVILVNKSSDAKATEVKVANFKKGTNYYWYTLTGGNDNGEFSAKTFVNSYGPSIASGGPSDYDTINPFAASTTNGIKISIPARAAVFLVIQKL